MQRTRQTNPSPVLFPASSISGNYLNTSGGTAAPWSSSLGPTVPKDSQNSYIVDVTGVSSRNTKYVDHYSRVTTRPILTGDRVYYTGVGGYESASVNAHRWGWGDYGSYEPGMIVPSFSVSKEALMRRAMDKLNNTNEVDNLLNAIESPQLIQGVKDVKEFLTKPRYSPEGHKLPTLKQLAGGYLGYSFGIAPLIADINKINRAASTLSTDLAKGVADYNKPFTATAQCKGSIIMASGLTARGYGYTNNSLKWWEGDLTPHTIIRTVGVRGRRPFSYTSDSFKKLDYLLNRFVSSGPASFVWERIPFSFVIDWFVDLSGIINSLDDALTGSGMTYEDGWWSELMHFEMDAIFRDRLYTPMVSTYDGQSTCNNVIRYYHREYMKPHISVGFSDKFGKKQASYLGALLYQTVANLKS